MSAPTKAAVRKADWERFKRDGGSLVVYPPAKSGKEMVVTVRLFVAEDRGDLAAAGKDEALAAALVRIAAQGRLARFKRQRIVETWCEEAFGADHAHSLPQRGVRLLEEAIELYQSAGGTAEMAHRLIDFIFGRPVGDIDRELGGVGITLLALAAAANRSADQCEADELARILAKPLEQFAARNEAKNAAGFNAVAPKEKPNG